MAVENYNPTQLDDYLTGHGISPHLRTTDHRLPDSPGRFLTTAQPRFRSGSMESLDPSAETLIVTAADGRQT